MEKTTVRLAEGATAEISEQGIVLICQDSEHAVQLTPDQAYWLTVWLVDNHLNYLDFKAYEQTRIRCFECREPLIGEPGNVYRLDAGDITLCGPCAADVDETVRELQRS